MPGASYWGLGNVFALAKKRTRGDRDATSHAAPYVYGPLPSRHIRLVKYTATKPKAPLALSLSIVTHAINDSCPPYIALSYTWDAPVAGDEDGDGSVTDAKYVLIDGTTSVPSMITIRQNLYDALQALGPAMLRMSRKEGVSHIWIDAICINQADATERSLQVGSMDKIYSSAASVWAWLGAADDTTSSVAWLHTKMYDKCMRYINLHGPLALNDIQSISGGVYISGPNISLSASQIRALYHFYARRRLLTRVWVVQELVLGHDVQLWIDGKSFSMAAVRLWIRLSTESMPIKVHVRAMIAEVANISLGARALHLVAELSRQNETGGPSNVSLNLFLQQAYAAVHDGAGICAAYLVYLLMMTSNHIATDPRDKLYGILGLMQHHWPVQNASPIKPDYNVPVERVYFDLTSSSTEHHLPSWVPNLAIRSQGAPYCLQHHLFTHTPDVSYRAFYANGLRQTAQPCFHIRNPTLFARGHMLGQVDSLSVVIDVLGRSAAVTGRPWLLYLQLFEYMIACCVSQPTYINGQHMLSAIDACTRAGVEFDEGKARKEFLAFVAVLLSTFYRVAQPKELALASRYRCMTLIAEAPEVFGAELSWQMGDLIRNHSEDSVEDSEDDDEFSDYSAIQWAMSLTSKNMFGRRMFRTNTQLIGLAHNTARLHDQIWILADAQVPFLLRPLPDGTGRYSVVGEAYVHGAMFGELVNQEKPDMWQDIEVV